MDNTRGSGQEGGNDNPQMTELRNMVQMLGETSEYRGVTEDPIIPMESVAVVRQFLKLKPPTFKGGMDPVKANDWILAMEKNFRLLRCGEQQKVEIGSYLLAGEASRWWNLKGVREPGMDWARFKVIFREKFVPRAVQNAKCSEFEHLKQMGTTIADYEEGQVQVCQKCGRYHWGVCWKDRIEVRNEIRCFHCNEVGHIKRNCPRLRAEAVAPRGGPRGGNVRPAGNARPGGNRPGNPGNRDGNLNNQRQGRAFALMPGDARNTEDVVAGYELVVSQPMTKGTMCSMVYRDCSVCIDETVIPTDLIPLEMEHFDVIFGMDWLSRNGATIHLPREMYNP
ncbi:hypothetical protein Acr_13g0010580 [Actinidia rufa]|uniref:CCHC-type domain-containing protein n=1 Tax=Actinidia rufa TaxID=165716 RepID=A0A7J0FLQ6_9ERIC|nr:hypothetical protein Acr_13g0010580 [Actinidia rufa]